MESQRFPDAKELIAGDFVRHSTAYYEWRISDRTAKPIGQRTALDYDDIAVSFSKLGQHDKAIETIREKMAKWPKERLYESEANLGTFYVLAGRYKEGLPHINRAIEINPEAHFGREIYQKLLVEYIIESRGGDDQLPLNSESSTINNGFTAFVLASRKPQETEVLDEIHDAVEGVLGMMRFASHKSPILLEALGDLLLSDAYRDDAKRLAAFAYLKASYEVDNPVASAAYRAKAEQVLKDLPESEEGFKQEIEWGDEFFRQIVDDESKWIADGEDVDAFFVSKYLNSPEQSVPPPTSEPNSAYADFVALMSLLVFFLVCAASAVIVFIVGRLRSKLDIPAKLQ